MSVDIKRIHSLATPFYLLALAMLSIVNPKFGLAAGVTTLVITTLMKRLRLGIKIVIFIIMSGASFFLISQEKMLHIMSMNFSSITRDGMILLAVFLMSGSSLLYARKNTYRLYISVVIALIGACNFISGEGYFNNESSKMALESEIHVKKELDKFSHTSIDDCMTMQVSGDLKCFVYSKRYPISTKDENVAKILKKFSENNGGAYVWSQRIQLENGRFEGITVNANHDVVNAVFGAIADENSIFVLADFYSDERINQLKDYSQSLSLAAAVLLLASLALGYSSLTSQNFYTIGMTATALMSLNSTMPIISQFFVIVTIFIMIAYKRSNSIGQ